MRAIHRILLLASIAALLCILGLFLACIVYYNCGWPRLTRSVTPADPPQHSVGIALNQADEMLAAENPLAAARHLAPFIEMDAANLRLTQLYATALARSYRWQEAANWLSILPDVENASVQLAVAKSPNDLRHVLDMYWSAYQGSSNHEDICFLARIAEVAGDSEASHSLWTLARESQCDTIQLKVATLSVGSDARAINEFERPPLTSVMSEEYRPSLFLAYFAYYGIIANSNVPTERLKRAYSTLDMSIDIYDTSQLNRLSLSSISSAYAGDAKAFAVVGDAFYVRGDLVTASFFYKLALEPRTRMIGIRYAAWASYRLSSIEEALGEASPVIERNEADDRDSYK